MTCPWHDLFADTTGRLGLLAIFASQLTLSLSRLLRSVITSDKEEADGDPVSDTESGIRNPDHFSTSLTIVV